MPSAEPLVQKSDKEDLWSLRHSTAHVMAHAVMRIFPEAKFAIGPPVQDPPGFYYDMELPRSLTPEDLQEIEERMREIVRADYPFVHEEWNRERATAFFGDRNQTYKLRLIEEKSEETAGETVHVYHSDEFTDLCKGPHVTSTKECKHFKLLTVSAAYWKGDASQEQLQRLYGTVWRTKEDLDAYLRQREEAQKRDHRKLGKELQLFEQHPVASGAFFWLHKGTILYNILSEKSRRFHLREGYMEVRTPLVFEKSLWETSGHWEYYQEDMFTFQQGDQVFGLKPMNCPAHMLMYKNAKRSYRDLPLRYADQGVLHRNELAGVLGGLTRARQFCQDDAHIFIMESQIEEEIGRILKMIHRIYTPFDLPYEAKLSTRNPEKAMGDSALWDRAETALEKALKAHNLSYEIQPNEAAFYGPKIDFNVRDAIGRIWQLATVQLDFNLPERFDLTYVDADNTEKQPVVVHRAIYGSFERFIGILIEHYEGKFPLWLSPVQVKVLTVSSPSVEYAKQVVQRLQNAELRVEGDLGDEKIGAKIRAARLQRVPYMLVIGQKEVESESVAVRSREKGDEGPQPLQDFVDRVVEESQMEF
ncbi:MAG: threonine--tRNA ligase [bacterium]